MRAIKLLPQGLNLAETKSRETQRTKISKKGLEVPAFAG